MTHCQGTTLEQTLSERGRYAAILHVLLAEQACSQPDARNASGVATPATVGERHWKFRAPKTIERALREVK